MTELGVEIELNPTATAAYFRDIVFFDTINSMSLYKLCHKLHSFGNARKI